MGININNLPAGHTETGRAVSCTELAGRRLSRREGLGLFLEELEKLRKTGPGELRDLWNSLAQGIGAPVIVIPPGHRGKKDPCRAALQERGIFAGIDHRCRCRIMTGPGTGPQTGSRQIGVRTNRAVQKLYPPGTASLIYPGILAGD